MNNIINEKFVNDLYDPIKSGIQILNQHVDNDNLKEINKFIKENTHKFEEKREKYIDNNQLVALLYRGPFNFSYLENTIFVNLLNTYNNIREKINQLSMIPFEKGTSIEVKLIHYPVSTLGVGIHKDLSSNINVVVFFNLEGSTEVKTYSNKNGDNPLAHFIQAGDISIMRAPRNSSDDIRPYHGVEEVFEPRTVLVIREINEELEELTNKNNWRGF